MAKITKSDTMTDNQVGQSLESSTTTEVVTIQKSQLDNLLERIETLEKNGPVKVKRTGKERYEGPRKFSYSTWAGVPVLSFESFKKDPTRDGVYKDIQGIMISNHYLKLNLADGKEVKVEVNDFNTNRQRSEKMNCIISTNEDNVQTYSFKTEDYDTITVLSHAIN